MANIKEDQQHQMSDKLNFHIFLIGVQNDTTSLVISMAVCCIGKNIMNLLYINLLSDVYPGKRKHNSQKYCTQMFLIVLLRITKNWKHSKFEYIRKTKYDFICIMKYYSTIKMNGILIDATTWMKLKRIRLN